MANTGSKSAKNKLYIYSALSAFVLVSLFVIAKVAPVAAADYEGNIINASSIDENTISNLLKSFVAILVYGIGAAATIGFIISGILYLTARDNPGQMQKAKTRFIEVTIGLVAWMVIFALIQWLVPGGIKISF